MKRLLQNNLVLFIPAGLFAIFGALLLYSSDKMELHYRINQNMMWGPLDPVFTYATYLGGEFIIFALIILLILNVRLFFTATAAYALSSGITQTLKLLVFKGAERPKAFFDNHFNYLKLRLVEGVEMLGENSFPSGHTTTAFALFFTLGLITPNKWGKMGCFLLALAVGFSRIYLSQHFFEDVYAGGLIGILFASVFVYIFYFAAWSGKMNKLDAPLFRILFTPKNNV